MTRRFIRCAVRARVQQSIITRARSSSTRASRNLWVSCFAARRIVGLRKPGATLALAHALTVSKDQIENYARAGTLHYWLRRMLRGETLARFREYRDILTVSHFVLVADLMHQLEFTLWEAFFHLQSAAEERLSVAALERVIRGQQYSESPAWIAKRSRLLNGALELRADKEAPEFERFLAGVVLTLSRGGARLE
jgi:hypothetical protein